MKALSQKAGDEMNATAAAGFDGVGPAGAGGAVSAAEEVQIYRKRDIAEARFGEAERQALIRKARALKEAVDRKIIGQGPFARSDERR